MKSKICGIYCIENLLDHKKYIGQSIDIERRIYDHKRHLKLNRHDNDYLQNEWNKYGENNFSFYIVEQCELSELDEKEISYINEFNTLNRNHGYNLQSGGQLSSHFPTEEVRQKISDKLMNHPLTERQLNTLRNNGLVNAKPVYCIETQEVFNSASEIKRLIGIETNQVLKCCKKQAMTAKDKNGRILQFCYLEDKDTFVKDKNRLSKQWKRNYFYCLFDDEFNFITSLCSTRHCAQYLNVSFSKVHNHLAKFNKASRNSGSKYIYADNNKKYVLIRYLDLLDSNIDIDDKDAVNKWYCSHTYKK